MKGMFIIGYNESFAGDFLEAIFRLIYKKWGAERLPIS